MTLTVADIAERVDGTVEGDAATPLHGIAGLREAGPGDLSFLTNPRYHAAVAASEAGAVIVGRDWRGTCRGAVIRVENPDAAFTAAAALFAPELPAPAPGVHRSAVVAGDAVLGEGVSVGPCAVIEARADVGAGSEIGAGCFIGYAARIGDNARLHPNVTVRERVRIGRRVILHSGAVIGSDGFGYVRNGERWDKIPQIGIVEIGDDVEIGANTTIDRARFGKTVIEDGVKIDNLVQVAHNVRIGAHTAIAAQAGISGSTAIGRHVQVGGQAGFAGHLRVGDESGVGAKAGVTKDVPARIMVSGFPAMPHLASRKAHAMLMRLPRLRERVAALEARVGGAEGGNGETS